MDALGLSHKLGKEMEMLWCVGERERERELDMERGGKKLGEEW